MSANEILTIAEKLEHNKLGRGCFRDACKGEYEYEMKQTDPFTPAQVGVLDRRDELLRKEIIEFCAKLIPEVAHDDVRNTINPWEGDLKLLQHSLSSFITSCEQRFLNIERKFEQCLKLCSERIVKECQIHHELDNISSLTEDVEQRLQDIENDICLATEETERRSEEAGAELIAQEQVIDTLATSEQLQVPSHREEADLNNDGIPDALSGSYILAIQSKMRACDAVSSQTLPTRSQLPATRNEVPVGESRGVDDVPVHESTVEVDSPMPGPVVVTTSDVSERREPNLSQSASLSSLNGGPASVRIRRSCGLTSPRLNPSASSAGPPRTNASWSYTVAPASPQRSSAPRLRSSSSSRSVGPPHNQALGLSGAAPPSPQISSPSRVGPLRNQTSSWGFVGSTKTASSRWASPGNSGLPDPAMSPSHLPKSGPASVDPHQTSAVVLVQSPRLVASPEQTATCIAQAGTRLNLRF